VCDTVTVVLGDIVLLAFEKILDLFFGHRKTAFLQLHKFMFTTALRIVFERFLSFFLSFSVSLSATLRENGWTDLHEIFREGVK